MIVISKLRNRLIRRHAGSLADWSPQGGLRWRSGLASLAIFAILTVGCLETEARPVAQQPPGQAVQIDGPPGLAKGSALEKIGPELARLLQQRVLQQGAARGVPFGNYVAPEVAQALGNPIPPSGLPISVTGAGVAIDAVASGAVSQLLVDLEALGLQGGASFGAVVSGRLPVESIDNVASLNSLRFARPAYAMTHVGLTTSQGDVAMGSSIARGTFTVDGSGITVGVLSDSFDCLGGAAADVASGDLPGGITVLQEETGCGSGTDEGRAMMQLIRDVAPGASQSFHTAFDGTADFANGIIDLAAAGADVIVDDVIYFAEPMFQDGIIAQAVDEVVAGTCAGCTKPVAYFSSAGNQGRKGYESSFVPGGPITIGADSYLAHDFDYGAGVDIFQQVTIGPSATVFFSFQWDQPYASAGGAGAANDLDIFLIDAAITTAIAGGTVANTGGDPVEVFSYTNPTGSNLTVNVLLGVFSGANPGFMKYVIFGSSLINEYATNSGTVYGHSAAAGARATGAAAFYDTPAFNFGTPVLESFSSAGPGPYCSMSQAFG